MTLHGHTRIELTDVHTGAVEVVESDNLITNAVSDIFNGYGGSLNKAMLLWRGDQGYTNAPKDLVTMFYGGLLLYDREKLKEIYTTGRGSFKVRARWRHLPKENIIEIYEIPYSTTVEAVIDKVAELVKAGKLREVADMRDETDLSGLKLAIDLKRGADPEQVMQALPAHAAVRQLCLQLQHPHRRHAARDGRARAFRRVVRVAHRERQAPRVLRAQKAAGQAAPLEGP